MSPFHESVVPLRREVPLGSVQGTLALDLRDVHRDPPPPGPDRAGPADRVADVLPIDRRRRRGLEQWAWRYAQAATEIAGGDRPVSQLLRWTHPGVYDDLARRALLVARAAGSQPGRGGIQSVRPQVLGVHACFVSAEAVEVSAHVRYGRRSRALAMRFELTRDRWVCTALEFA